MTIPYDRLVPGPYTLQQAATTGNGAALNCRGTNRALLVFVEWSTGCSAGQIEVEQAADGDYAGTWSHIATISWSAANRVDCTLWNAPVGAIRARVASNITGGTVTVKVLVDD